MHSPSGLLQWNGEDGGVNCLRCSTLLTRNALLKFIFSLSRAGIKIKIIIKKEASQRPCRHAFNQMCTGYSAGALRRLDPSQLSTVASSEEGPRRARALLPCWLGAQVGRHQPGCVDVPRVFSCHWGFFSNQCFAPRHSLRFSRTAQGAALRVLGTSVSPGLSSAAPASAGTHTSSIHAAALFPSDVSELQRDHALLPSLCFQTEQPSSPH